jgi:hypothetical protein
LEIRRKVLSLWHEASARDDSFRDGNVRPWNHYYFVDEDDVEVCGLYTDSGKKVYAEGLNVIVMSPKRYKVIICHGDYHWETIVNNFDAVAILNEFEDTMCKISTVVEKFEKAFWAETGTDWYQVWFDVMFTNVNDIRIQITVDEEFEIQVPKKEISGTLDEISNLDIAKIAEDFLYQETN